MLNDLKTILYKNQKTIIDNGFFNSFLEIIYEFKDKNFCQLNELIDTCLKWDKSIEK